MCSCRFVARRFIRIVNPAYDDRRSHSNSLELEAQNLHNDLIKRVVGLPGDVVQIHDGQILINGKVIVEPYVFGREIVCDLRVFHFD